LFLIGNKAGKNSGHTKLKRTRNKRVEWEKQIESQKVKKNQKIPLIESDSHGN
jgi:hypothetical protein